MNMGTPCLWLRISYNLGTITMTDSQMTAAITGTPIIMRKTCKVSGIASSNFIHICASLKAPQDALDILREKLRRVYF